jgi:release factor glutamine methyltransferase
MLSVKLSIVTKYKTQLEEHIALLRDQKYCGHTTPDFFLDQQRLIEGEPIEYVIGYTDFLGAYIDLSLTPMIPRPETAFWVERAIKELKQKEGHLRIADTFAGAGNVGVALARSLHFSHVDISELDPNLKRYDFSLH